jgi:hypothetical protein
LQQYATLIDNRFEHNDFDTLWKEALELFFQEFVEFFFPLAAQEIVWEAGYKFLDTDLQQIMRDAEIGKRFADGHCTWLRNRNATRRTNGLRSAALLFFEATFGSEARSLIPQLQQMTDEEHVKHLSKHYHLL